MRIPDSFRTTECGRHGHPEFTLVLAEPANPAGLESWLLDYLQRAVASGTRFLAGQSICVGWATARVIERADATLGIEERIDPGTWVERVDRLLDDLWRQTAVAESLDLTGRLAFPAEDEEVAVESCGLTGSQVILSRGEPEEPSDSGWVVPCLEDHAHQAAFSSTLLELTTRAPFMTQFLALPVGAAVRVSSPEVTGTGVIGAEIAVDGQPITPRPGSYLATLNGE